jgi:hypothetical protein
MWPTILTGLFFGMTLVVVVIPSLYIADLDAAGVYQPASANAIHADNTQTSPGIRQRIYLIFMIPAMAVANGLWVYLMYYRHVRNAFYRMEIGELENSRVSRAGKPVMKLLSRASDGGATGDATPVQQPLHHALDISYAGSVESSYIFGATTTSGHHRHNNTIPPTSSSSSVPASSSTLLQRQPSNSSPNAVTELFQSRGFVLAALPSTTSGSSRDFLQHRRRADVSREECPVPFCAAVASLVNVVDRVLEEGSVLRSKAAGELLRRVDAARGSIVAAEEQESLARAAVSSPGTSASPVFKLNAAVQGFSSNNAASLDTIRQELDELQEIANDHPHVASPISIGSASSQNQSTRETTITIDDDNGRAASTRANGIVGSPTQKKATRMKRAGSRVVFTRSRSQQPQRGSNSRGVSPNVAVVGSGFTGRQPPSGRSESHHLNEPDAA